MEIIREQNRIRAKRYYDNHRELISQRRKARREGDYEPIDRPPNEIPYSQTVLNKINNEIGIIQQELKKIKQNKKVETNTVNPVNSSPKNYSYTLDETIELIKSNVENVNSQRNYIHSAKNIYDILKTDNLFKSLKNFKKVIYTIKTVSKITDENTGYSVNTIKQLFQTILKLITMYDMKISANARQAYQDEFDIYKIESSNQTEKKKVENELLNFDEYMKLVKSKFGEDSREYLTIALYKVNTFRDDLGNLYIVDEIPKQMNMEINYIVVPKNKNINITILLNAYKTAKKYGQEQIPVNREYSKLIRNYIEKQNLKYNDYLFNTKSLSKYISNFNKKLGLNYTINTIRKMKISSELSTDEAVNNAKLRLKVAKQAHHNPMTSMKVYKHKTKELEV